MVTPSQLSAYIYCPRKLFISYVLKIKEPLNASIIKGLIWHQTYETINSHEEKIVRSIHTREYTDILDIYRREYAKYLRNSIIRNKTEISRFGLDMIEIFKEYWTYFDEEAKNHALRVQSIAAKTSVLGDDLWNVLTPKPLAELHVSSEINDMTGIIDVAEVHSMVDGTKSVELYVPIELKTGIVPEEGIWEAHKIQLAAYMSMLEDSGKNVAEGVVRYKGVEDRILSYDKALKTKVLDLVCEVQKILKNKAIPDKTSNMRKCARCAFKDLCHNDSEIAQLIDVHFKKSTIKE